MPLSDQQYEVLSYVEQQYAVNNSIPTRADISDATEYPEAYVNQCFDNPDFKLALQHRGISTGGRPKRVLTQKQLAAVATMLDRHDTRSDKKKLQDLEIPTQTWAAWQRDPVFSAYYYDRANRLYMDALVEAPRAILDNVARGDLSSIKYVHEMTGVYSEKSKDAIDITSVIRTVLDIITSEVTDGPTLDRVSKRLLEVLQATQSGTSAPMAAARGLPGPGTPQTILLNDL